MQGLHFEELESRRQTIEDAQDNTCEWLFERHEFIHWIENGVSGPSSKFLWLKGKPATGKSTMMKLAYERIKQRFPAKAIIVFFFNARGEAAEHSTIGMYRSLLYQLLSQIPRLRTIFDGVQMPFDAAGRIDWKEPLLKSLIKSAVGLLQSKSLVILIDALDECSAKEVKNMVNFFHTQLQQAALSNGTDLRVFFSSRHYPHINIQGGREIVLEDQTEHTADIAEFVESNLPLDASLTPGLKQEILRKARGVFLWVVLVVRILRDECDEGNMHLLVERLREIPLELEQLLENLLEQARSNNERLVLCVQWVLFAKRPMTVQELYWAILSGSVAELRLQPESGTVDAAVMDRLVLSSSRGLLDKTKGRRTTVQFIHESVREFFLQRPLARHGFGPPETFASRSHDTLKSCCLNYIRYVSGALESGQDSSRSKPAARSSEHIDYKQKFPLMHYVVCFVFWHSNEAEVHGSSQVDFVRNFPERQWKALRRLISKKSKAREVQNDIGCHLARLSLPNLLRHAIPTMSRMDNEGTEYGDAFSVAVRAGSVECVTVMLKAAHDYPMRAIFGGVLPPLTEKDLNDWVPAVMEFKNDSNFAIILLRFAFNVNLPGKQQGIEDVFPPNKRSLLTATAYAGASRTLALLFERFRFNINQRDGHWDSPISAAVRARKYGMMAMLLSQESVRLYELYLVQPLSRAINNQDKDAVRMLLDRAGHGIVVHDEPCLREAATRGYTEILELILGHMDIATIRVDRLLAHAILSSLPDTLQMVLKLCRANNRLINPHLIRSECRFTTIDGTPQQPAQVLSRVSKSLSRAVARGFYDVVCFLLTTVYLRPEGDDEEHTEVILAGDQDAAASALPLLLARLRVGPVHGQASGQVGLDSSLRQASASEDAMLIEALVGDPSMQDRLHEIVRTQMTG